MKLFIAIAAAAVIGTSFVVPNPAEARNGWVKVGCADDGCLYYRKIKKDIRFATVEVKSTFPLDGGTRPQAVHRHIDCDDWQSRTRFKWADSGWDSWGPWNDLLPGTIGDSGAEAFC